MSEPQEKTMLAFHGKPSASLQPVGVGGPTDAMRPAFRAALEKYGHHLSLRCHARVKVDDPTPLPCECGLDELLAALSGEHGERDSATLSIGDVVQIDPAHDERFGGCFMVVTEPKGWGAQGYVAVPGSNGLAYYRCPKESMIRVGRAEWLTQDAETDRVATSHPHGEPPK